MKGCCSHESEFCKETHSLDGLKARDLTKEQFERLVHYHAKMVTHANASGSALAAAKAKLPGQEVVFAVLLPSDATINTKVIPWRAFPRSEKLLANLPIRWELLEDPKTQVLFFIYAQRGDKPADQSCATMRFTVGV